MMDSIPCTDKLKESGDQSHDSVLGINNDSNVVISGSQSPKANVLLPFGPVTPDSNKEIGDVPFNLISSPLTRLNKAICFDTDSSDDNDLFISTDCNSPRTPSHVVFDPFAPGPEDMMMAPRCKKPTRQPKLSVSRRLDFCSDADVVEDGSNDAISLSDDEMIESVYANLLKVIILTQTKGVSKAEWDSDDDCKTPPLAPRLKWIAETCPGAPMKLTGKSKGIDLGLCRKLEF